MNDWQDRWVDAGLQELHGRRPPDLSARVVLALQEARPGQLPTVRRARRSWWRYAVAAAALVLLGVLVGALLPREREASQPFVQLDLHVQQGELLCVEVFADGVQRSRHGVGAPVGFVARAGNRLLAAAPSRFQVGPFGELATGPATELEVRSMTVNWKHGVVAASSLTIAVVAGVVTWHTLSQGGTATAGEVVHLEAGGGHDGAAMAAENSRLRERLRQLEQQNADLQLATARQQAPPEAVEEPPPPPPEPVVAETGPVFADDAFAEALAALDWDLMGKVTNEMGPMLVELAEAMEQDGELPLELIGKITELNAKLIGQVPAMLKAGLPGTGANGAYTHPLVSANILAKTLAAAGVEMDATQRDKIAGLVRASTIENRAVADSVQEFDLQRVAAEVEAKDRFYREVASQLTPEQYRVMFPEGADRFEGTSLFHSSLFTAQLIEPVSAAGPADFAGSVAQTFGKQVGLDEAAAGQVRAIVERMASAAPELWQQPASQVETDLRMMRSGRTGTAMRHQIEMMREILRQVPMTPAQRKKFTSMKRLFVPLPQ
jgi:anti-sigma-K factor RskA